MKKQLAGQPGICPLCNCGTTTFLLKDSKRRYHQCKECKLIYVDKSDLLSPSEERARYEHHRNTPTDEGYREFLSQLAKPLLAKLGNVPHYGLDFGCGPGPTLSVMLEEAGHTLNLYDPYFAPYPEALLTQYDFVTCSEAIEHFYNPAREWQLLMSLLKPGGWLGLMTSLAPEPEAFKTWHYKNDETHVCFFSRETFEYLADHDCLKMEIIDRNVILIQKEWPLYKMI